MDVITSGKEYFYAVPGLMTPKYMVSETLTESHERFVDWVPQNTENLKTLAGHNIEQFVKEMQILYVLLRDIYAHWLEMEAARILRLTETNEKALCAKLVMPFVANLRTLAIDIQMAQNKGFDASGKQRNELEKFRDIISSMKIIANLIGGRDYEKALDIAIANNELQESAYGTPLISCLTAKDVEKTTKLVNEILQIYNKKIEDINIIATVASMRKRIVIVDDMPETLTALNLMLEEYFHIFSFTKGSEALGFIDTTQAPDAFLLDIDMPEMDGFTIAKKIRARARYERTPLLFLTGNSTKETIMKATQYDVKAFIVKPANKDIIISKLCNCLK